MIQSDPSNPAQAQAQALVTAVGGIYYFNGDYSKPTEIKTHGDNRVTVRSSYWGEDTGVIFPDTLTVKWGRLGEGKLHPTGHWNRFDMSGIQDRDLCEKFVDTRGLAINNKRGNTWKRDSLM